MEILAIDVSKANLEVFDGSVSREVKNCVGEIEALLLSHPNAVVVCEPTGRYHYFLVETAVRLGHTVYLVNPREAKNYKESMSFRAKTDKLDAHYLYQYVMRNSDLLRPYRPASKELAQLRELLGRRQGVVESRTALTQSLGKELSASEQALLSTFDAVLRDIEAKMDAIASQYPTYELVRSIPGVGRISGCALVFVLESKSFENSDQLVAFLGLDVRIRQSGKFRGLEKLSKRGDPILRFLICFAGRGLLHSLLGRDKRKRLEDQGRKFPERMVIAARKILRVAFQLHKTQTAFQAAKWSWA